jgi:dipeptidyl aminopeptidase/acylaminoacyl peptidase
MLQSFTDADGAPEVRLRVGADGWPRAIGGARGPERDRATQPRTVRLSPDGQHLAVDTYGNEHLILLYPTAGGPPVRLDRDTTDQHGASWSPDGNWLAYRRTRGNNWELVKAPLGGGPVVRLADSVAGGGATDWSSRGDWIALAAPDGIHLESPDGSAHRLFAVHANTFRFSRDGSQLLTVRRGANGRPELSIWDVISGREVRALALPLPSTATVQGMTQSPDGSRVVVGVGTPTSDVWILEQFEVPEASWTRWLRR